MIEEEKLGENPETVDATENTEVETQHEDANQFGDSPEDVAEARKYGYKTPDEYDGNPAYQISAKEYLARKEKGGTIKKLESDLTEYKKQVQETNEAVKRMAKFHEMQLQRTREEALAEAKRKYARSIEDEALDPNVALDAYEKDRNRINESFSEPKEEPKVQTAPEITKFYQENSWYNEDDAMRGAAIAMHQTIASRYPAMPLQEQLDMVKKQIVERFPDKFKSQRKNEQRVDGSNSVHSNSRQVTNTYKSIGLSESDILDAKKLIAQGLYKDEADFVKDYKILNGVK